MTTRTTRRMPKNVMGVVPMALLLGSAAAMPLAYNETSICEGGLCAKADMKYERIIPAQPGYQWNEAGGYCGSWSIQRASLTKGAYISQQQVRTLPTRVPENIP